MLKLMESHVGSIMVDLRRENSVFGPIVLDDDVQKLRWALRQADDAFRELPPPWLPCSDLRSPLAGK